MACFYTYSNFEICFGGIKVEGFQPGETVTMDLPISPVAPTPEFKPWGKTPRWDGGPMYAVITEKLDGTNALVHITDDGRLFAGSRNRWLDSSKKGDNYGFHKWCMENQEELLKLGAGYHYGEWWGSGIGRGYGAPKRDMQIVNGQMERIPGSPMWRKFSLFDTKRWGNPSRPACCDVVPALYEGVATAAVIDDVLAGLKQVGSLAAPGFMNVEGIIVYFPKVDARYKYLAENHDKHKFQTGEVSP